MWAIRDGIEINIPIFSELNFSERGHQLEVYLSSAVYYNQLFHVKQLMDSLFSQSIMMSIPGTGIDIPVPVLLVAQAARVVSPENSQEICDTFVNHLARLRIDSVTSHQLASMFRPSISAISRHDFKNRIIEILDLTDLDMTFDQCNGNDILPYFTIQAEKDLDQAFHVLSRINQISPKNHTEHLEWIFGLNIDPTIEFLRRLILFSVGMKLNRIDLIDHIGSRNPSIYQFDDLTIISLRRCISFALQHGKMRLHKSQITFLMQHELFEESILADWVGKYGEVDVIEYFLENCADSSLTYGLAIDLLNRPDIDVLSWLETNQNTLKRREIESWKDALSGFVCRPDNDVNSFVETDSDEKEELIRGVVNRENELLNCGDEVPRPSDFSRKICSPSVSPFISPPCSPRSSQYESPFDSPLGSPRSSTRSSSYPINLSNLLYLIIARDQVFLYQVFRKKYPAHIQEVQMRNIRLLESDGIIGDCGQGRWRPAHRRCGGIDPPKLTPYQKLLATAIQTSSPKIFEYLLSISDDSYLANWEGLQAFAKTSQACNFLRAFDERINGKAAEKRWTYKPLY
ncbi:Hypothetical protein POVR1_LOCUS266 [uncultured virus]|nr:Hypothetical protein POVR1_LOCUS266 [uncultured virus]